MNLRLLNSTVISSSANKIKVTDVFSSDFDIYCITISSEGAEMPYIFELLDFIFISNE